MFVVDTNVLLYAADSRAPEHRICRDLLEGWRRSRLPWYVTWTILYEFLRVSTHPRVFDNPWTIDAAWTFVEAVLASPGLGILIETPRHRAVVAQVLGESPYVRGNRVHDTRIAVLMREHGVRRIVTRDRDFSRFPFLEVVDPLV